MKMLVTGATSGLGRNLVTHLLQKGFDVTATGRNVTAGALLAQEGAKFLPANIADTKAIDTLCANIDMVFHCAALSSPWGQYNDFYSANVLGTKNVVAGCLKHHVSRLIHVSTPSIYFDFTAKLNINENDPLPKQPANYYAATKLEAEHIVEEAFEKYGLPVISIRPRAMFGPYDATIVPRILRASKGGRVPLIGGGNALVDATYVGNVVESLLLCAKAPASCFGKKYNITNGEPLPFKLFLEKIFENNQ